MLCGHTELHTRFRWEYLPTGLFPNIKLTRLSRNATWPTTKPKNKGSSNYTNWTNFAWKPMRTLGSISKLHSRWDGLFVITNVFPYGVVELKDENPNNTFKVNGHQIKLFHKGPTPIVGEMESISLMRTMHHSSVGGRGISSMLVNSFPNAPLLPMVSKLTSPSCILPLTLATLQAKKKVLMIITACVFEGVKEEASQGLESRSKRSSPGQTDSFQDWPTLQPNSLKEQSGPSVVVKSRRPSLGTLISSKSNSTATSLLEEACGARRIIKGVEKAIQNL
ncbi:hypothetical protein CR513_39208, partial [Mucuna pruriens]